MTDGSFIETINSFFGGALTTLIGAFTGRLMYHSGESSLASAASSERNFSGKSPSRSAWPLLAKQSRLTSA